MTRTHGVAILVAAAVAGVTLVQPRSAGRPSADDPPAKPAEPILAGSAIAAVLAANGGKAPATGVELAKALGKLGDFAQLPVAFSAARLDSGLGNPRVVLTPAVAGLSGAGVTETNLHGRLFLAANMEPGAKVGDPRVTSVEFISWNTLRRRFDFGVIEGMGGDGEPQLRVVDGGRCSSCHKNKGPILGAAPWTNTAHLGLVRDLVADRFKLVEVVPAGGGGGLRDRIDGMALVAPRAAAVDEAVRLGSTLRLHRETFRLMNRSDPGRKAFVAMLVAIACPSAAETNEREARRVVGLWGNDASYLRFTADWAALAKATNSGVLADFAPFPRAKIPLWSQKLQPIPAPPPGGFASPAAARNHESNVKRIKANNDAVFAAVAAQQELIAGYDAARAAGKHGVPSASQPSNPRAFVPPAPKPTQSPTGMVNPLMLAGTIGLTGGDRKFFSESLAAAAGRVNKPKVTAATLARAVFEGPEFADVLAGGPLPDRDEFKDRFVAGLDQVLTTRYAAATGFAPDRRDYASGPRYDPKAAAEEVAVVPTTACLRCHDVRPAGTARLFESIPALAFDPFDKAARADWVRAADRKRKQDVLARLLERMHADADMPPQDSPEHDLFRVKDAAAFQEVRDFLEAELGKVGKP